MTKPADVIIANQTSTSARTDINNVNVSLVSNFTRSWNGTAVETETTEPTQTYSNMWWSDTDNDLLKIRADGNDAWIPVAYLDQTNDKFRILDDTQVVDTSGTQTGLLGDQDTLTWETGTGTTESLVSPAKLKAAADSATESKLNISGTAPIYGVRAWVNFDGTGSTSANQALRATGNIASVYKNTTGNYTVTFTTAMPDANYAVLYGGGISTGVSSDNGTTIDVYDQVAGSFKVNITDPTGNSRVNIPRCYLTIVR